MKKFTTLALALILLASAMLAGCDQAKKTGKKNTLVFANYAEPASLDPPNQNMVPAALVCVQIYDGLLRQNNETGKPEACLAKSWERVDDYTIRFHLRDDVYFHDGGKMTAEDVKFTFDHGAECSPKEMIFEPFDVSKTKIIDEYTVELGTKTVFPAIFSYLTNNACLIISKKAFEQMGAEKFGRNPVGTGAYKFVDWIAGDRIILERNDKYWGEKPEFKNVIIRTIPDDSARGMAVASGDVDIAFHLAAAQVDMLSNHGDVDVFLPSSYITQYCALNERYKPLSDVRVRQALRYALDMETMAKLAFGICDVADGAVTPAISIYKKADEQYMYKKDIEKAKALLKDAGYEDGFDLELTCNESQPRVTLSEMLANAWGEIGVRTHVHVMEFSAQLAQINAGESQAYLLGFVAGGNDGEYYRTMFQEGGLCTAQINYSNPKVNELFDLASKDLDEAKRNAYYYEIQDILREDLPWIFVCYPPQIYAMRKDLTGLDLDPEAYTELRFIKTK